MKILIFGGTSEAHRLSDQLTDRGIAHTLSVATEYGERILKKESPVRKVLTGRLDDIAIAELIKRDGYDLVIDATHPYAVEITENIIKAVSNINDSGDKGKVTAVRLARDTDAGTEIYPDTCGKIKIYEDVFEAADALVDTSGNILLTTGSKDLGIFTKSLGVRGVSRLYARVIPGAESIRACEDAGVETSHIIAMQGPFSPELNKAMICQYDIKHLVTKDSGSAGGTDDKIRAAGECGISVHIIKRPKDDPRVMTAGYREVLDMIMEAAGTDNDGEAFDNRAVSSAESGKPKGLKINLIGMGMGDMGNITKDAFKVIKDADVILGSARLIDLCRKNNINDKAEHVSLYKPQEIVKFLCEYLKKQDDERKGKSAAVLFSGDSGYNSGCRNVYETLNEVKEELGADISIYPGISSVSSLAALTARPYDDAYLCSMHGKGEESIYKTAAHIRINSDVYALTGGCGDIIKLANLLNEAGMGDCVITAAADMSSSHERIIKDRADRYAAGGVLKDDDTDRSLYTCHIYNPSPVTEGVAAGLGACEFIRGNVPMTKEEVRSVTIDKLRLIPDSRVLDIGCGTGSVTVEIARLIPDGMVYAYDVNDEAIRLTKANLRKHKLPNAVVKQGCAPEIIGAYEDCPAGITHVFIGGNKGRLSDILDFLKETCAKQDTERGIRVVLNAITDKTRDVLKSWINVNEVYGYEAVRVGIGRGDEAVPNNEVFIYSFEL